MSFKKGYFLPYLGLLLIITTFSSSLFAGTWKIMPIGNSITDGVGSSDGLGFRQKLYTKLNNGGVDFQFVGGDGASPYNGHFLKGAKIDVFLAGGTKDVTPALNSYQPNMVLIHLGTNNINNGAIAAGPYTNPASAAGELYELLKLVSSNQYVTKILLCKIVPRVVNGSIEDSKTDDFNAEILNLFFERPSGISYNKITIVDMNSIMGLEDYSDDDLHPDDSGYEKMAGKYYNTIKGLDVPDNTNPSKIAFQNIHVLDAEKGTVQLTWRAPGDDGYSGTSNLYELRYATFQLDNFSDGKLEADIDAPQSYNSVESKIIYGLVPGLPYHFRIRAYDEHNNAGPISDEITVQLPDVVVPEYEDDFADADAFEENWNAHPSYQVVNGELSNTSTVAGWEYLATFKHAIYNDDADYVETQLRYSFSADDEGINSTGIAMLLDDSTSTANGYLIFYRYGKINLYEIIDGEAQVNKIDSDDVDASSAPSRGDLLVVNYNPAYIGGRYFSVFVYKEDVGLLALGSVVDPGSSQGGGSSLFSGAMLFGNVDNNVDDFKVRVPALPAHNMEIYAGNGLHAKVTKKLAEPLTVKVTDVNGNGAANVPVDFTVTSGNAYLSTHPDSIQAEFNGNIWIEAEDGDLELPMIKKQDVLASENNYIVTTSDDPDVSSKATYQVYIPVSGTYTLWIRVLAPDGLSNSCFVSIRNTADREYKFNTSTSWNWGPPVNDRLSINLDRGFTTLVIRNREKGTQIDKILLTSNSSYVPTQLGKTTQRFSYISDASGYANTELTFDSEAGVVEVEAVSSVPNGSPQTFQVYADAFDPSVFVRNSNAQVPGSAGQELSEAFSVQLSDQYNNLCVGYPVDFVVQSGDGHFLGNDSVRIITDDQGIAEATLTLGFSQETIVHAVLPDFPAFAPIEFAGIIGEGIPTSITYVQGNGQTGTVHQTLSQDLQVQVLNEKSEVVANYPVPFEIIKGNGKLDGQSVSVLNKNTDANGIASVSFTLGDTAGVENQIVQVYVEEIQNQPILFKCTATHDVANKMVIVSGKDQQQSAGLRLTNPFVVKVTDSYDNPVDGYQVKYSVIAGNGNFRNRDGFIQTSADTTISTDEQGLANIYYTAGSITGENQIKVDGQPALSSGSKIFYPDITSAPASDVAKVSGDNPVQQAVVKSTLSNPFIVQITDPFGNSAGSGHQVDFTVLSGGGNLSGETTLSKSTDSNGRAQVTLTLGQTSGTQAVQVTLTDYPNSKVFFYAYANPGSAAKISSITDRNFYGTAGEHVERLGVLVTDIYNNAKPNHSVAFNVNTNEGLFDDNSTYKVVQTDTLGQAFVNLHLGTDAAVTNRVMASSSKNASSDQLDGSPVEFIGTVLPDTVFKIVKLSGDNPIQGGQIGTTLPDSFVIQTRDQYDNYVSEVLVKFLVESEGGLIGSSTQYQIETDFLGKASVYLTLGQKTGVKSDTVSVSAPSYPDVQTVNFYASALAGQPVKVAAVGDTTWQLQLLSQPIELQPSVLITDEFNNPVIGNNVLFKVIKGDGTVNSQDSVTVQTNSQGIASVDWLLNADPDTNIVVASAKYNNQPLNNSPIEFQAITTAGEPTNIQKVDPVPASGIANLILDDPLQVKVTDSFRHPVINHDVQFEITNPASGTKGRLVNNGDSSSTNLTVRTNKQGIARVYFIPVEGNNIIKATTKNSSDIVIGSQSFIINAEQSPATTLEIVTDKILTVTVGSVIQPGFLIKDAQNSNVADYPVQFNILNQSGSLGESNSQWLVKNSENSATTVLWNVSQRLAKSPSLLQVVALNSQGQNLIGSPDTLKAFLVPGAVHADSSKIETFNQGSADGITGVDVTITLKDLFGNPISGKNVSLASEHDFTSFTQPADTTNILGETTGKVKSTKAGEFTFKAVVTGDPATEICCGTAVFTAGLAEKVIIISGDNQTGNAGALLKLPFKVQTTDNNLNPVGNARVRFKVMAGNGVFISNGLDTLSQNTDSEGFAECFYVLGQQANITNQVNASLIRNNSEIDADTFQSLSRTGIPDSLIVISGNNQSGSVGDTLDLPFTVKIVDADTIPVWNALVQFTPENSGSIVGQSTVKTDSFGNAAVYYKLGYHNGEQPVSVKVIGTDLQDTFTATGISGPATNLQYYAGDTQVDTVGQILPEQVAVLISDEDENPVAGVTVDFTIVEGAEYNCQIVGASQVVSNDEGIAQVSVKLGEKTGEYGFRATSPAIQDQSVYFTAQAQSDKGYKLSKVSGDFQYMTRGRELVYPVVVKVTDKFDNSVKGDSISFSATLNSGSAEKQKCPTDSLGLAGVMWTIGGNDDNELWAIKQGLTPSYQIFRAYGVENAFPEFKSAPLDTVIDYTNGLYEFQISVQDDDNDPLQFIIENMPFGAVFDTALCTFKWTPTAQQKTIWNINFKVYDNKTGNEQGFDEQDMKIEVIGNSAPVIESYFPTSSSVNIGPGDEQVFQITAFDPDDDDWYAVWYVDGIERARNQTSFTMTADEYPGNHGVECVVSDETAQSSHVWLSTDVKLVSFSASHVAYQGVKVEWVTSLEENNIGFNVLRSLTENGKYIKINENFINSRTEKIYSYIDSTASQKLSYYYKLVDIDRNGRTMEHGPIFIQPDLPKDFIVHQNFPNPFNPETKIRFETPETEYVTINIYNITGQLVKSLVNNTLFAGYHEIVWDAKDNLGYNVGSGVYYYHITAGSHKSVRKMVLLR